MHFMMVQLFSLSYTLEKKDHSPPHGGHVDRFEGRVEDEHRFLHNSRFAVCSGRKVLMTILLATRKRQDWFLLPTYTIIGLVRVHLLVRRGALPRRYPPSAG